MASPPQMRNALDALGAVAYEQGLFNGLQSGPANESNGHSTGLESKFHQLPVAASKNSTAPICSQGQWSDRWIHSPAQTVELEPKAKPENAEFESWTEDMSPTPLALGAVAYELPMASPPQMRNALDAAGRKSPSFWRQQNPNR
jgi:hypothetical protein